MPAAHGPFGGLGAGWRGCGAALCSGSCRRMRKRGQPFRGTLRTSSVYRIGGRGQCNTTANVHPAEQLAQAMRRIYAKGYTTTSGGDLSLRDKDGSLWITPTAVDKGTLSREDILHVLCDGTVAGKHKVSCDMPFHAAVLKARPDLNCVLHAHSKALAAYSAARKALPLGVLPRHRGGDRQDRHGPIPAPRLQGAGPKRGTGF